MIANIAALLTHYTVAGFNNAVPKLFVSYTSPLLAAGIGTVFAGTIIFCTTALFVRNKKINVLRIAPLHALKGALFRNIVPTFLAYWALQYISVGKYALFYTLCPFISYVLSYLFLHEIMTWKKLLGILIGSSGIIPIILAKTTAEEYQLAEVFYFSLPELATLMTMITLCFGMVELKKMVTQHPDLSVHAITSHDSFLGGVLALTYLAVSGMSFTINAPKMFFSLLLIRTITTGGIIRPLYSWLLKTYSPTFLSIAGLSIPFSSAFFGWVIFSETIGWEFFVATALALVGCVLYSQEEQKLANQSALARS